MIIVFVSIMIFAVLYYFVASTQHQTQGHVGSIPDTTTPLSHSG